MITIILLRWLYSLKELDARVVWYGLGISILADISIISLLFGVIATLRAAP
jgi:hypothetical protein